MLAVLAIVALAAGTVQTVNELEYVDAMTQNQDSAVVEVIETDNEKSVYESPDAMKL